MWREQPPRGPTSVWPSAHSFEVTVRRTYTSHLYETPIRRTLPHLDCTAYSCQVMGSVKTREGERTKLSRSAVVDRALALADSDGVDALTIRRLATELGVTPMALYWHFRSKEELLAGLGDQIWSELDTDVDTAAPWHL